MGTLGRKLLPASEIENWDAAFAWLVRALRAFGDDPRVRNTASFAGRLAAAGSEDLKPATINRLETGSLAFTVERCRAYEEALGLDECQLVDPYIWASRLSGKAPKCQWNKIKEAGADELDLILRVSHGDRIEPLDWLQLSYLYRNRPDLFSSNRRLQESFFRLLMEQIGDSYERDQRILREAIINIGDDAVPYLLEYADAEPIRYFVAIEAMGFMRSHSALSGLLSMPGSIGDPFLLSSMLDPILRSCRTIGTRFGDLGKPADELRRCAVSALTDPSELFASRESSLEFITATGTPLGPKAQRVTDAIRTDLRQLRIIPESFNTEELISSIERNFATSSIMSGRSPDQPLKVPGLDALVRAGLFAAQRNTRLTAGIILAPWPQSQTLTDALGRTLRTLTNKPSRTARASSSPTIVFESNSSPRAINCSTFRSGTRRTMVGISPLTLG